MASRRAAIPEVLTPQQLSEAYRRCFTTEAGEQVLADLKKRFGRRRSFVAGQPDTTAFNDGQRDVYLMVLSHIDRDMKEPD